MAQAWRMTIQARPLSMPSVIMLLSLFLHATLGLPSPEPAQDLAPEATVGAIYDLGATAGAVHDLDVKATMNHFSKFSDFGSLTRYQTISCGATAARQRLPSARAAQRPHTARTPPRLNDRLT